MRRQTAGWMWAAAVAAMTASGAMGQEPGEPQAPLGRLRQFGGNLLGALSDLKPKMDLLPVGSTEPIEPQKLNLAVSDLIRPIIQGDASIESLSLSLDPLETDLAQDRVGLLASVVLRRSAWSNSRSYLQIHVLAHIEPMEDGRPKAQFDVHVDGGADVIGLANYVMPKVLDKLRPSVPPDAVAMHAAPPVVHFAPPPANDPGVKGPPPEGPPTPFGQEEPLAPQPDATSPHPAVEPAPAFNGPQTLQTRLWEMLSRRPPLNSMDDAYDLVMHCSSLTFLAKNEEIELLGASLAFSQDPADRQRLYDQLVLARRERDKLTASKMVAWRDADDRIDRVTLNSTTPSNASSLQVERLEAAITAGDVQVHVTAKMTDYVPLYLAFKPVLLGVLSRLQSRDPAVLDQHRGFLRGYYQQYRPYVLGDRP